VFLLSNISTREVRVLDILVRCGVYMSQKPKNPGIIEYTDDNICSVEIRLTLEAKTILLLSKDPNHVHPLKKR
jgi:hypothetical protein